MEKTIPLDVVHALRQLGINPDKALAFMSLEAEKGPQPELDIQSGTPSSENWSNGMPQACKSEPL